MAKRKDFDLVDVLLVIGGIWLLKKLLYETATGPAPGIHGPGDIFYRKMLPLVINGKEIFLEDLRKVHREDLGKFIRCIKLARLQPVLKMPYYRSFENRIFTGEIRFKEYRIMVLRLNEKKYILLSLFKKQSDDTPENEKQKADQRARLYLRSAGK